jgi:hypothetical protein
MSWLNNRILKDPDVAALNAINETKQYDWKSIYHISSVASAQYVSLWSARRVYVLGSPIYRVFSFWRIS